MLLGEDEQGISAPIVHHALSPRKTSVSRDTNQPKNHIEKIH
ncbi:protein of unknown function [Vibrio tapetis subsp. tapetis]|uniref:Uncharacterized protein n=1 Tax=Vibrio tapetis subsp. tapetis TaxID=1671868 RepID=A0A2N8ZI95_9VIBR|nr:protein of unknown function [Vibrio tapetis subsp. tapetis]